MRNISTHGFIENAHFQTKLYLQIYYVSQKLLRSKYVPALALGLFPRVLVSSHESFAMS